jgi:hypothetical protein
MKMRQTRKLRHKDFLFNPSLFFQEDLAFGVGAHY